MDKIKAFFTKENQKIFWGKFYRSLIWLMVLLFVIDIVSKWIIQNTLELGQVITLIPNFLSITLSHNMGASFGMGNNGDIGLRILWLSISVIMSAVLIAIYAKTFKKLTRLNRVGIALMISGAVGNMIDRLFYWQAIVGFDGVIDWISFSFFNPIFNIADSALVIGAVVLLIAIIIDMIKEAKEKKARGEYDKSPKELEKEALEKEEKAKSDAIETSEEK